MTRPVTVVIPALGDTELLERALPPLLAEVDRRALGDEVVVVDDTGEDVLAAWAEGRHPALRVVPRAENGGFARALLLGVEAARHPLVFSMNSDVVVRAGFLDPLVVRLAEADVFAAAPRVLLNGEEDRVESITELAVPEGAVELRQPGLGALEERELHRPRPIAFAVGGTFLFRREELLADGFDPLYEPFYWEDVDLGFTMWRRGRRVVYEPASVVEHHHRGTIGRLVDEELVRAAIERNRLLFQWKHLGSDEALRAHVAALVRGVVDAWLADERDELVWFLLALDRLEGALAARQRLADAPLGFEEALRASRGA